MSNNYSVGQQSVGSYTQAIYNGDMVGAPLQVNPAIGGVVSLSSVGVSGNAGIDVGTFAFYVDGTNNDVFTQLYNNSTSPNSTVIAGYVWRGQYTVYANAFINQGYSMTVPIGKGISVMPAGTFAVIAPSISNDSDVIAIGDTIYVVIANTNSDTSAFPIGSVFSNTATPSESNVTFLATNFKVLNPSPANVTSANLVYMSNTRFSQ